MQASSIERTQSQTRVNEFIRSVYNWMAIGLGLTGLDVSGQKSTTRITAKIVAKNLSKKKFNSWKK